MKIVKDKTLGLKRVAKKKQQDATERTLEAISKMIESGDEINFSTVAAKAKVSRTWLYRQEVFKTQIEQTRTINVSGKIYKKSKEIHASPQIEKLKIRIKKLEKENLELKKQVEIMYGQLYQQKFELQ